MRGLLGNQLVTQKTVLFILNTLHLSATGNYLVTRVSVWRCRFFVLCFALLVLRVTIWLPGFQWRVVLFFFGGGGAFGSVGNYLVTRVLEGGCVVFLWCFALLMVRVTIWLPVIWVVAFVCIMGWNYEVVRVTIWLPVHS